MSLFFLVLNGVLLTMCFGKTRGLVERAGWTVFFCLIGLPWIVVHYIFLFGRRIGSDEIMMTGNALALALSFCLLFFKKRSSRDEREPFVFKDAVVLTFFSFVALGLAVFYYSDKEFLLAVGSYFVKGDAECFYLQAFQAIKELSQNRISDFIPQELYHILCTPGNVITPIVFLSIFKGYAFRILYALFIFLILLFVYLLILHLVRRKTIAVCTALFSVFNPYVLSIEVLDRNLMVFAMTSVFFYLLFLYPRKYLWHGFVFGILAGMGLRFLPMLFLFPSAMIYCRHRSSPLSYLIFLFSAIAVFAFNIPHLYFHGFSSLGENTPFLRLVLETVTQWLRTPFVPFPPLFFYLTTAIGYFGYLSSALMLMGFLYACRTDKKAALVFLCTIAPILFILSSQRDWIEADKYRIIVEGFLAFSVFFAYGLAAFFQRNCFLQKIRLFFSCLLSLVAFVGIVSSWTFREDGSFYRRKWLYQKETRVYYSLLRQSAARISFFPGYGKLAYKSNVVKKAEEELLIRENPIIPRESRHNSIFLQPSLFFLRPWQLPLGFKSPGCQTKMPSYINLAIDFEYLATDLSKSVVVVHGASSCAVDVGSKNTPGRVYHGEIPVTWQSELLPVTVFLDREESSRLKAVYVELNAFRWREADSGRQGVIDDIHFSQNGRLTENAQINAVVASPLPLKKSSIVFCLPSDYEIIIRNWFINSQGAPLKIDSWRFTYGKDKKIQTSFFYNEPETYL